MLIGELAAETGNTTRVLRYHEQQGLLESSRKVSGYRLARQRLTTFRRRKGRLIQPHAR